MVTIETFIIHQRGRQLCDEQSLIPRYIINFTHITANFFSNFTMYIGHFVISHAHFVYGLFIVFIYIYCMYVYMCIYIYMCIKESWPSMYYIEINI